MAASSAPLLDRRPVVTWALYAQTVVFVRISGSARFLKSIEIMKRWLWTATIVCAAAVSSCEEPEEPCEYGSADPITLTVSLSPALPGAKNCTNVPVEVKLLWDGGGWNTLRTSDGSNPPRACVEALGLIDGAKVQVYIQELIRGSGQCNHGRLTLLNGDEKICDAVCHEAPSCPASPPIQGSSCVGNLPCDYGDRFDCPPDQGYVYTYDCVNGLWIVQEKGHCPACAPNCDPPPPPCIEYCADAITETPLPPTELTFCHDWSAALYGNLWTCMCITGNPCESVCNTVPAGETSFCEGGPMTIDCQNCVVTADPAGCSDAFNACANDW
jgi:hypothetical protein